MSDLEHLRKDAKRLLKQCRAGDTVAIARVRGQLPLFAELSDSEFSERLQLAHVQHALAREQGAENWSSLKGGLETALEDLLADARSGRELKAHQLAELSGFAEESIHAASVIGESDGVARHLEIDPSLLYARVSGWTPLHYGAASQVHKLSKRHAAGIVQCAAVLLERDADAYDPTTEGPKNTKAATAITLAERSENPTLVRLLDPRRVPFFPGYLPMITKVLAENVPTPSVFETPEFRALLMQRQAERRVTNPLLHGKSERLQATLDLFRKRTPKFEQRVADLRKPKLNAPTEEEKALRSFLLWVSPANKELWRYALENGLDPNWPGWQDGETALHKIATLHLRTTGQVPGHSNTEMAALFLSHGADPNRARTDGKTPYRNAVRNGNLAVAQLLLEHGATPESAKPVDRLVGAWSRMDAREARAILQAHPGIQASLSEEDREFIVSATQLKDFHRLEAIAESGIDLAVTGAAGATALHLACWQGNLEAVRALLNFNAPVNVRDSIYGVSPLAWAAHGSTNCRDADDDYCAIVQALKKSGADFATAINRWNVAPDAVASPSVVELLRQWRSGTGRRDS